MWNMSPLLLCLIGLADAGNQAATWQIPKGEEVVSLTGKMNVPKRGSNFHRPNRGMVAYWPALKGHNFFMQTCLVDSTKPQGWVTQNAAYDGECAGKGDCYNRGPQRNDHEHILKEGGTFSFYIEQKGSLWVAGFTTTSGLSSEIWMKMEGKADSHVTALLLEDGYDSADETPTESLEVWDIVAKNAQGKSFDMTFSCNQGGRKFSHINCNWSDGSRKGVQVTFGHSFNETVVV